MGLSVAYLGSVRNPEKPNRHSLKTKVSEIHPPLTETNFVMAKRYELSDQAWDVVSDLFIENP